MGNHDDDERPDVVLIVFDSVRAKVLSAYGGETRTPAIDWLADRGTLFERAFSVGHNTAISHGSLFSGQYPTETGILASSHPYRDLTDPVISSWLRDSEYDTFGIVGGGKLSPQFGFDRGFDEYFVTSTDIPDYLSRSYITEIRANSELRWPLINHFSRTFWKGIDHNTGIQFDYLRKKLNNDDPTFTFANFMAAHTPYDPPRPYKERATPALERPRWFFLEYLTGTDQSLRRDDVRDDRIFRAQTTDGVAKYLGDPEWLSDNELEVLFNWYTASIEYLDDMLGAFLRNLTKHGRLSDTIVILTADHGEHFGEHDRLRHGYSWYDECLHVPLLVAGPGVPEGERVERLVSLVDLFDTICDLVGVQAPSTTSGTSMFSGYEREAVFAEKGVTTGERAHTKYMSEREQRAFNLGWKAIKTEEYTFRVASDGTETLYRRPGGQEVTEPEEPLIEELRERLFDELSSEFKSADHDEPKIDDRLRSQLRELGYIE